MTVSPERLSSVLNREVLTPNRRLYKAAQYITALDFHRRYKKATLLGIENLAAIKGRPALIAPTHSSGFDIPDVDVAARAAGLDPLRYAAKIGIAYQRGMGDLFMYMGVIPLVRPVNDDEKYGPAVSAALQNGMLESHPDTIFRKRAVSILKPAEGLPAQHLVMYPEGTRRTDRSPDNPVGFLEPGVSVLARRSGALILPMAIIRNESEDAVVITASPAIDPLKDNGRPYSQEVVMEALYDGLQSAALESYKHIEL